MSHKLSCYSSLLQETICVLTASPVVVATVMAGEVDGDECPEAINAKEPSLHDRLIG